MREADRERQKREWEMKERQAEEQRTREEELRRRQQEEMAIRIRRQEEELHRRQQENNLFMQVNVDRDYKREKLAQSFLLNITFIHIYLKEQAIRGGGGGGGSIGGGKNYDAISADRDGFGQADGK